MIKNWNASMPRQKAPVGCADVVIAFRGTNGERMEFEGILKIEDARALLNQAIGMSKECTQVAALAQKGETA